MIDFTDMKNRQQRGLELLETLEELELDVIRHYCSLSTEALIELGKQKHSSTDQIVINAMRSGIALGLMLKIESGEIV